jgi:hypothetical protein
VSTFIAVIRTSQEQGATVVLRAFDAENHEGVMKALDALYDNASYNLLWLLPIGRHE